VKDWLRDEYDNRVFQLLDVGALSGVQRDKEKELKKFSRGVS
jgi:hypothetical protein